MIFCVFTYRCLSLERCLFGVVNFVGYVCGFGENGSLGVFEAVEGAIGCRVENPFVDSLGLVLRQALYFVMAILQFIAVRLVIIFWAIVLAFCLL